MKWPATLYYILPGPFEGLHCHLIIQLKSGKFDVVIRLFSNYCCKIRDKLTVHCFVLSSLELIDFEVVL